MAPVSVALRTSSGSPATAARGSAARRESRSLVTPIEPSGHDCFGTISALSALLPSLLVCRPTGREIAAPAPGRGGPEAEARQRGEVVALVPGGSWKQDCCRDSNQYLYVGLITSAESPASSSERRDRPIRPQWTRMHEALGAGGLLPLPYRRPRLLATTLSRRAFQTAGRREIRRLDRSTGSYRSLFSFSKARAWPSQASGLKEGSCRSLRSSLSPCS
jgi:hypothetical protein